MSKKCYIIAGEASGDLHGSNLVKALKKNEEDLQLRGFGGDKMQAEGVELVMHIKDLAFMGFVEVLMNLRTIARNIRACKRDIKSFKPDAVILIDYPGFNLRIAEFAHNLGCKVIYYISPQVWAWKQSRVKKIKRWVDHMLVILPFEKDFFKNLNYHVDFVGHPLLDEIQPEKIEKNSDRSYIALLPGSRRQEISIMLPIMLEASKEFHKEQFVIVPAPGIKKSFYKEMVKGHNVELSEQGAYGVLAKSKAALVTSGTATLETAMFKVPQVVCYKGGKLSYMIAKKLIKVKYISLVNLILDSPLLKELIQNDLNKANLIKELQLVLFDEATKERMFLGYEKLVTKLGGSGASDRAASLILKYTADK